MHVALKGLFLTSFMLNFMNIVQILVDLAGRPPRRGVIRLLSLALWVRLEVSTEMQRAVLAFSNFKSEYTVLIQL